MFLGLPHSYLFLSLFSYVRVTLSVGEITNLLFLLDVIFGCFLELVKVMISAKEEPDASISPAMDGLLRVHKRIIDGLDGESGHAPSGAGNTAATRLLVAATQAGSLIGKQGATIKSIQEASNSIVRILGMIV